MIRRALFAAIVSACLLATSVHPASSAPAAITFTDITGAAGLTSSMPEQDPMKGAYLHAAAWGDVDADGDADLFVGTFTEVTKPSDFYLKRGATGPMPNRLFLNDGTGRFTVSDQPALALYGVTSGAVFADLDDDGDDDLVVSNYTRAGPPAPTERSHEQNHLYRNDRGRFVEVTDGSGIRPADFTSGRAVGVLDYDVDGCLDLYLVVDGLLGNQGPSRLLKGACNLKFTDVTEAAGLRVAQGDVVQGLGIAIGDVDGDGLPDIFVPGGPKLKPRRNYLFRNSGDGTFTEVSGGTMFAEEPARPGATEDWTSAASFGDLNRDGKLDLVVSHHFDSGRRGTPIPPRVYLNQTTSSDAVSFDDVTASTGIVGVASKTPHVEIADLDNDGWPDIYLSVLVGAGRQPVVYRHTGTFAADGAPIYESPADLSAPHYSPGGPLVDVNSDGRLEPFLDEFDPAIAPPLFRNDTVGGQWLDVAVKGRRNTDGVGAVVRIYETSGRRRMLVGTGVVQIGNGFSSASLPIVHFGLGSLRKVDIEVTPPGGGDTVVQRNAKAGRRVTVNVGRGGRSG